MTDDDIKRVWGRYACDAWWADALPRFRALLDAARGEERHQCINTCKLIRAEQRTQDCRDAAHSCVLALENGGRDAKGGAK